MESEPIFYEVHTKYLGIILMKFVCGVPNTSTVALRVIRGDKKGTHCLGL
jgi:hypothetical protein